MAPPTTASSSTVDESQPDEGRLEIALVASCGLRDRREPSEWITLAYVRQPEMARRLGGVGIERKPGARPHTTQLSAEQPDRRRPPARKVVENGDEGCRLGEAMTDPSDLAAVAMSDHFGECLEASSGPKIVATIPAGTEALPAKRIGIDDPSHPGSRHLVEGPFSRLCCDAVFEQRGRHKPSLDLGAELAQIAAADLAKQGCSERRRLAEPIYIGSIRLLG